MPALVREGEDVAQDVFLVVHEDVGFAGEAARGKGARALAAVFVAVHPAAEQARAQGADVFRAKWGERFGNQVHRLVVAVARPGFGQHGNVDVPVAQPAGRKPEGPRAQRVILVQCAQVGVDGCHEVVVHGRRHVVGEEGGLARARVFAHGRLVGVELRRACVQRSQGVRVRFVGAVEASVGRFAHRAVGVPHEGRVGGLGNRPVAFRRGHGAEVQVHVGKDAEGFAGELVGFRLQRQNPFLRFGQDVRLEAQQLGHEHAEIGEGRVGQAGCDKIGRQRLDRGHEPGPGRLYPGGNGYIARKIPPRAGIAFVLGDAQVRPGAEALVQQKAFGIGGQNRAERFRSARIERGALRRGLFGHCREAGHPRFPGVPVGE